MPPARASHPPSQSASQPASKPASQRQPTSQRQPSRQASSQPPNQPPSQPASQPGVANRWIPQDNDFNMIFDGNQQKSFKTNDLIDFFYGNQAETILLLWLYWLFWWKSSQSHYIIMTLLTLYVPGTLVLTWYVTGTLGGIAWLSEAIQAGVWKCTKVNKVIII